MTKIIKPLPDGRNPCSIPEKIHPKLGKFTNVFVDEDVIHHTAFFGILLYLTPHLNATQKTNYPLNILVGWRN